MKPGRNFTRFAVFTVLFVLMSTAFAIGVAAAPPTQPTHSIDITPQAIDVSYPGYAELTVNITRTDYGNNYGTHGIGWLELFFNIHFDHTRFEPVPFATVYGIREYASSDLSTWLDVNGAPARNSRISAGHLPGSGVIRVRLNVDSGIFNSSSTPVMSDVVVNLRFRVRENAALGNNIPFSWQPPFMIGNTLRCPFRTSLFDLHHSRIDGLENRGNVNVVPPRTHKVNIVPNTTTVSRPGYVDIDIHIMRLPCADNFGNYGMGWVDFGIDVYFDDTRFELVSHGPGPGRYVVSDFNTWISPNGWPIASPQLLSSFPMGTNGTFRIWAMDGSGQRPVMSDIVLHLRFRVLENATPGNAVFSWGPNMIGVTAMCPVRGIAAGIRTVGIYGPSSSDFAVVNVLPA